MKNKKALLSLILSGVLAASVFAGCGSDAASSGSADSGQTAEADGAEEAAGEEEATEEAAGTTKVEYEVVSGADGATWKIGAIGPTTGAAANYGSAVVNATALACKEINEAGGINGYMIDYKGADDELDNEKSVNAYNSLKDWGMQMLIGSTTSGCSIAVSEKTKEDNMFQLTPSGTAVDCVKYDNVFRVCFSDPEQGTKSAEYISEHDLASKIGIIYDSSDVYSSGIEEKFVETAETLGLEVLNEEAFTADSNTDFSSQLQACKDSGVEMIFLPIYYTQAGAIISQASTMGLDVSFFGCDGLDGMLNLEGFDTSLAEGVMLLTPFSADSEDERTQNFVSQFESSYGVTPNQFGADAYDGVYALKTAIEAKNLTPDMSISDICEDLKAAFTEIEIEGLTGTITWEASGEPDKEPKAVVIENGKYVMMS